MKEIWPLIKKWVDAKVAMEIYFRAGPYYKSGEENARKRMEILEKKIDANIEEKY